MPRAVSLRSTRCLTARSSPSPTARRANRGASREKVKPRDQLVVWDPHITPILAEKGGTVRYEDIEEGETVRIEEERKGGGSGEAKLVIVEHKGERHPRITIE